MQRAPCSTTKKSSRKHWQYPQRVTSSPSSVVVSRSATTSSAATTRPTPRPRQRLEHCRALGDRYEEAATYRILALSAGAIGKPDEAKKWFDEGFAYYDDIETPYEWGKLWMAYGDWLLGPHAGAYADRKGALEAYYAARDHFEGMGAEAKLGEVKARIEKLVQPQGDGPYGRVADANLHNLTKILK